MAATPEQWLDSMLDLPTISLSPCTTCEALFRQPGLSVWNKRPFAREVQSSGVACARCRLVYAGVSAALPDAKAWGHVRLLAFLVVGREQKEDVFLRVGALDYGPVPSDPLEDVPTLFRDVIKVARALSARFLWIDALCIVQDDENDWSQEAQKMGSYYGNAWLTIAADDAPGVSHTIFPPQRNPAMWLDQGPTGNGTPPVLLHRIPTHIDMTDSVVAGSFPSVQLFSRAWALQERLLSRRILHMGPQEGSSVPFRERHHKALHSPPETAPRLGDYWEVMLAKYLAMQLSFDDDRLKAIAALAKDFKASDQRRAAPAVEQNGRLRSPPQLGDYVFGLWTQRLPASLLWATTTVPSPHEPPVRNPNFPTWSWASIPGSWLYQTSFSSTHGYMDGIVAKSAVLEVPDEAWDITDRPSASHTSLRRPPRIVVEGAAVAAKCRCIATTTRTMSTGTSTSCKWELSDDMSGGRGSHTVQLDLEPRDDITEISLVCVEIAQSTWGGSTRKTRYHGLLLEPSALFPGYYMRLGTMEATSDWFQANGAIGGKYSII
ncbi:HET-domain-containing protein [Apiospora marii]|uniref:HET-domain-containing protein n=1 Tax=Apiospora marii TaxID=335849 RepID=A0ABR1R883_9PEZI